jgi:hypothetical protein
MRKIVLSRRLTSVAIGAWALKYTYVAENGQERLVHVAPCPPRADFKAFDKEAARQMRRINGKETEVTIRDYQATA